MARILILVLVVVGVVWWLRAKRKQGQSPSASEKRPEQMSTPQPMVACHLCGTHLPQNDALQSEGQWYCCTKHRDTFTT